MKQATVMICYCFPCPYVLLIKDDYHRLLHMSRVVEVNNRLLGRLHALSTSGVKDRRRTTTDASTSVTHMVQK